MDSRVRSYWIGGAVVVAMLCAAWYFGSPRWALWQMRDAAAGKDADKLSVYIDYPAFRASLKEEMKAKILGEVLKPDANPMAALGVMMVDSSVDAMVTPATMREMFSHVPAKDDPKGNFGMDMSELTYTRKSVSEFWLSDEKSQKGGAFIFKRDGLGWKLSGIRMPEGAISDWAKQAPSSPP